jgi:hypothetical protein
MAALAFGACLSAATADARIVRFDVTTDEPAFAGQAFGQVGQYRRIVGRAHGEVDPAMPGNAIIQDIALAPRNARGLVEYWTDVEMLVPADRARANGMVLLDVVNRGNKRALSAFNLGSPISNVASNPGDGFLMNRGYTVVFFGWQPDLLEGNDRVRMGVPVARNADGSSITGVVRTELVTAAARKTLNLSSGHFTQLTHTSYPTVSTDNQAPLPDGFRPTLTVRAKEQDARVEIPPSQWRFADCEGAAPVASDTKICLDGGFQPGRLYELMYRAKDPLVLGLSYAAMRDLGAWFRYDAANPAGLGDRARTLLFGTSQSGRNMRLMLHLGFNQAEDGRLAYDAMLPHIGGGLAAMNIRFAQPGRAWGEQIDHLYPAYDFPFTYARVDDPITGRSQGILDRCSASSTCPKIFHVATALEVWEGRQSLGLTDPLGTRDIADPANVRTYILASTQHAPWTQPMPRQAPFGICQQQPNPNVHTHTMRALLVALEGWTLANAPPPDSVVPRIADGTLVPPGQVKFPRIPANAYNGTERPAVKFLGVTNPLAVLDFGPGYNAADSTGVISIEPPRVGNREYRLLVPQVDADGNDLGGIRAVPIRAPVGTYTGWNLGRADRFEDGFCSLSGSHIPFAPDRAAREATGDPRRSLAERYPTRDAYVAQVRAATAELVAARLLLAEDAAWFIAAAEANGPVPNP